VGEQLGPLAHEVAAPAEQIAGRAQLGRVDLGQGNHPAAQEDGDLVRINLIVLGFAPVNGFPIEGLPQDKGNAFLRAKVGQPVPGEETFHCNHQIVAVRRNDL
jgi:hypothetical protein